MNIMNEIEDTIDQIEGLLKDLQWDKAINNIHDMCYTAYVLGHRMEELYTYNTNLYQQYKSRVYEILER